MRRKGAAKWERGGKLSDHFLPLIFIDIEIKKDRIWINFEIEIGIVYVEKICKKETEPKETGKRERNHKGKREKDVKVQGQKTEIHNPCKKEKKGRKKEKEKSKKKEKKNYPFLSYK